MRVCGNRSFWIGVYISVRPGIGFWALLALMGCGSQAPRQAPAAQQEHPRHPEIIVGDRLGCNEVLKQVRPPYPPDARKKRIQDTVRLRVVISKTGDVTNIEVLKGDPALVPATVAAVKQWRYTPCLLNGDAVEVRTVIDVNFTLNQ